MVRARTRRSRRHGRGRRWALELALVASALAIAGCGSSSSSHTGAATASTAKASTTTATATTSAGATTPASHSTGASGSGVPGCTTSDLQLSLISGQGAAGTAYITYGLTNVGARRCAMVGYPGVAVLDSAGRIVQHPARRGTSGPAVAVRLITLAPHARARFLINSTDVIPSPGCPHAYTGVTLQVFPPNQRAALRRPYSGQFCNLRVGPVQRG